ncbi:hypothetical protein FG167_12055 [Lacinutrix sp. WUR7]|uniref:hypothetical protein n=1 Tax=Lacinutrix sp. WUR7 TaxID=2653681 RepID=UPI00193E5F88|nr:hypothetical protein [Lacinutrix sp. WUR7]QRM89933.1 hypothetical protein FG167_12055 [Lacinutrix sp. WUR7]
MVLNNIEQLLEKYNNGETSLKEEQQLKDYFEQETVAPHLEMYKPMFAYFSISQEEKFTKDVPLKSNKNNLYAWISVAAVAVLMLGFYFKSPLTSAEDLGTYEDPEMAYLEVKKSLEMISTQFNKGASSINYLAEVENTTSLIFKK